jgi:hypothetical protein
LKTKPFREVWQSKSYHTFREQLMNGRKNIDICSNCSEGLRVWEN